MSSVSLTSGEKNKNGRWESSGWEIPEQCTWSAKPALTGLQVLS